MRIQNRKTLLRCRVAVLELQLKALKTVYTTRLRQLKPKKRRWWTRKWLSTERREQFGLYDQLMVELRNEDKNAFENFMRMPTEMYDEIVYRLTPRLKKKDTSFRKAIPVGLKVAIALRHLASGTSYMDMRYGWRVPHNTISRTVKEVGF